MSSIVPVRLVDDAHPGSHPVVDVISAPLADKECVFAVRASFGLVSLTRRCVRTSQPFLTRDLGGCARLP